MLGTMNYRNRKNFYPFKFYSAAGYDNPSFGIFVRERIVF